MAKATSKRRRALPSKSKGMVVPVAKGRSVSAARIKPWKTEVLDPGWSWDDRLPYVEGKRVGPFIYTAGQAAVEPDGTIVGKGDIKAQTHKAFENIRAVLKLAGADLSDIVKITTYITDESKFNDMLEARGEVFGEKLPASTAVIVKALALPDMMVEIEAVAIKF